MDPETTEIEPGGSTETTTTETANFDGDDASYDAAWEAATAEDGDGSDDTPEDETGEEEDGDGSDLGSEDGEGEDDGDDGDDGEGEEEDGEAEEEGSGEPAPSWLPRGLKENWSKVPPELRGEIASSYQHLGERLGEQGRLIQGLSPIKEELVTLAKEIPSLAAMTPDQVVQNMRQLALINQQFDSDPVRGIVDLIEKYDIAPQMAQLFSGMVDGQGASMIADSAAQLREMRRMMDPSLQRQQFESWQAEQQTQSQVVEFAEKNEHWAQVEPHLISVIPVVKQMKGPDASAMDVLQASYEMVASQLGLAKAPGSQHATSAKLAPDPERAKKAAQAKSVNVTSNLSGRTRRLSEDEMMSRAYDKAMRRSK